MANLKTKPAAKAAVKTKAKPTSAKTAPRATRISVRAARPAVMQGRGR